MALTDIEKLRIYIADTIEPYLFSDEELQSFLDENDGNVIETAAILRPLVGLRMAAYLAREKEGEVEVYSGERAQNYLKYLEYFEDEGITGETSKSVHLVGGVSIAKNDAVDNNPDSCGAGVKVGMFSGNTQGLFRWY